jgi:hypothetical protein
MENQIFQAMCVRVANEKDPQIVELFKNRLRLLLREDTSDKFFYEQPLNERGWGGWAE